MTTKRRPGRTRWAVLSAKVLGAIGALVGLGGCMGANAPMYGVTFFDAGFDADARCEAQLGPGWVDVDGVCVDSRSADAGTPDAGTPQ